jgi:hypothetical protein
VQSRESPPTFTVDEGWPGEVYHLTGAAPAYTGGMQIFFQSVHLAIDLRNVTVIVTGP